MKLRTAVSISLLLCGSLLTPLAVSAAPASAAMPDQGKALPERLARLMRDLDQDQSRRLGRVGGGAADSVGPFLPATLGQVAEILDHHPDQTLVIFARPRRAGQARLDVDSGLLLKQGASGPLDNAVRARQAYVYEGPLDVDWNGLLAGFSDGGAASAGKRQGLEALAKSRTAAFVFLLKTDVASKATVVQKLILVPDTVMISFGGVASPSEPAAPMGQGGQPLPPLPASAPAPSSTFADQVPARPLPMPERDALPPHPEPPQLSPRDIPPPVEPPGDEDR